ncbi:MAG: Uridine kinase [Calditrichaeota bacterium]|nr:Uridine kinase [Calditrichota bacterium]
MKPVALVGIAGGTCSGKSLVSRRLIEQVGEDRVLKINQDSYYRDLRRMSPRQRARVNFDHPDAFANDELLRDLDRLLTGEPIDEPIYNYVEHIRETKSERREPKPVIILEGILVLEDRALRERMNYKVYVDEDADIRLARRIRRDEVERGRSAQSILNQYEESVRPMHLQFVETSKRYADIIIPRGGENLAAIEMLANHIRALIGQSATAGA